MFVFLCSYCASILFQLPYRHSDIVLVYDTISDCFLGMKLDVLRKGNAIKNIMESNTNSVSHDSAIKGLVILYFVVICSTMWNNM